MSFNYVFQGPPDSTVAQPGTTLAPSNGIDTANYVVYINAGSGWKPAVPATLASVTKTAQGADISTATLYAVPKHMSGLYEIMGHINITTVDGTSSTMPKITIGWTDAVSSQAQTKDITATSAGNVLTTYDQGAVRINAKLGTNITYVTSGYVSNTGGQMKFAASLRAVLIG